MVDGCFVEGQFGHKSVLFCECCLCAPALSKKCAEKKDKM